MEQTRIVYENAGVSLAIEDGILTVKIGTVPEMRQTISAPITSNGWFDLTKASGKQETIWSH